jgi:short-subunit dehydrogenase
VPRPIALITGASSGIGATFADRLAQDGYDLVVVARRQERLEEMAARITAAHRATVEVIAADLVKHEGLSTVEQRAGRGDIALLVNNAGQAGYAPFVDLDVDAADDLLRMHGRAVLRLTRAVLPAMLQRRRGAVINVSSLLSLSGSLPPTPLPYRATYAGAKAFILTFTQALAGELQESGITLQVLLPGVVATEFHQRTGLDPERLKAMAMQPADVVNASLTALRNGEVICIPGLDDPSLIDRLTEAQRALLQAGNRPQISERYRNLSEAR